MAFASSPEFIQAVHLLLDIELIDMFINLNALDLLYSNLVLFLCVKQTTSGLTFILFFLIICRKYKMNMSIWEHLIS